MGQAGQAGGQAGQVAAGQAGQVSGGQGNIHLVTAIVSPPCLTQNWCMDLYIPAFFSFMFFLHRPFSSVCSVSPYPKQVHS